MRPTITRNLIRDDGITFISNTDCHRTTFVVLKQMALQLHQLNECVEQNNVIIENAVNKNGKIFLTEYSDMMGELNKMAETLVILEKFVIFISCLFIGYRKW